MLKVEDPIRGHAEAGMAEFGAALASLLALRYLPAAAGAPARIEPSDPQRAADQKVERALGERQTGLEHRLLHYALSSADLAAGRIDRAAVAVIRLPEWLTVAPRTDDGQRARMDAVIERIQEAVAESPLAYAALLDDQVILAAHSAGQPPAVEARIVALVALELRNRLLELTAGWGEGSEFRVAIDIGPVMATRFGNDSYSLWGGAIAVAKVLATSGGRRAITVSETAYQILSGDFLFRQRGTYFLPETGTMRTFVLVGAL
jgi:class 3 adenylate cyclase